MSSSKPVWTNQVERDAWVEKNCRICFQTDEAMKRITGDGPGCPHLARGDENKLPKPWVRRRNAVWGETFKCEEFIDKPPVLRRSKVADQTEPMLDAEPGELNLVPVEGWPDFRALARKSKESDHQ